jgi:hypothetical protein
MMNDSTSPSPFVVGEKYWDRDGEYTVVAIDRDQVTIEREDGRRTTANGALKARIHRYVVMERVAPVQNLQRRQKRRGGASKRTKGLIERILQLEADGATHSGVDIDRILAASIGELGYSEEDVSRLLPKSGRSVFANDGDWAKAEMTEQRWHEVVDTLTYLDGDVSHQCNVYRITQSGRDELNRRRSG